MSGYIPVAGEFVLVEGNPPMVAEVVDPRPYPARDVVKVIYEASRTGAYVAAKRVLGPAPRHAGVQPECNRSET